MVRGLGTDGAEAGADLSEGGEQGESGQRGQATQSAAFDWGNPLQIVVTRLGTPLATASRVYSFPTWQHECHIAKVDYPLSDVISWKKIGFRQKTQKLYWRKHGTLSAKIPPNAK